MPNGPRRIVLAEAWIETMTDAPLRDGENLRASSGRAPQAHAAGGNVYAALDLGTNNCRLLVAKPEGDDGFVVIDSFSRIIRLGEGISTTRRISDAAISRAMGALRICRDKIRFRHATRLRLIATEACRAADNADAFLQRVQRELGLGLEVIGRETEATLAVLGCSPLLDARAKGAMLFDIGGGSTELVRLSRDPATRDAAPKIEGWVSLPIGVVTLAEKFGGKDVTAESYTAMVAAVAEPLAAFAKDHNADLADMHLLGTSGTVTTVAGVYLDLPRYDRRRIDGIWMDDDDVTRAIKKLNGMSYQQRADNACIGVERADLVLAGCAILDAIRNAFPLPRLRVADRGLREGMLIEMMREDRARAGHAAS